MTCSANTFKSSFINQVIKRETKIYLIKGTQNDFDVFKQKGYRDLSGGELFGDYFYVLCDSKWLLNKSVGDNFLSNRKIAASNAISYEELLNITQV